MLAANFEIGKVYSNEQYAKSKGQNSWWWVSRYNKDHVVCVRSLPKSTIWVAFDHTEQLGWLSSVYEEVPLSQLTPEEQTKLQDWMDKFGVKSEAPKGCTCEIMVLMANGCQCGWIKVERSKS